MSERKMHTKSIGHYVLLKTIGEGTFGKVKLGTHVLTGERVAIKVLEKERIVDVADVERVARELHILKLIRKCRHIIQLYEIIETPRQLYLIMEYASGGELFDYIVKHGRAEEREACRFLHQILAGVERVHSMRVVHRDLKPENLLLDDRRDIKIVDFGLSNTHQEGQLLQTACGSPCYAAPEMIAGHKYHPPLVDIWSCGVILFALVCGYLPFEDQNHAELYKKILNAEYEKPDFLSPEVADLITGILCTDPAKRMTVNDIRQHVWYRQIPEASLADREDASAMDEDILSQLVNYGFTREYAVKCLSGNKHNHVTTTYHLIKEKSLHSRNQAEKHAATLALADLEATAFDAFDGPGPLGAPAPITPIGLEAEVDNLGGLASEATGAGKLLDPDAPLLGGVEALSGFPGVRLRSRSQTPGGASFLGVAGTPRLSGLDYGLSSTRGGYPVGPRTRRRPPSAGPLRSRPSPGVRAAWLDGEDPEPTAPLTARARVQGMTPLTARARGRALSARGAARAGPETVGPGTYQVSCGARMSPQSIVQEVVRVLAMRGMRHRQVSSFVVRCAAGGGVHLQAEVGQQDTGGGYALRLSRVSGDFKLYQAVCAQLLADVSF